MQAAASDGVFQKGCDMRMFTANYSSMTVVELKAELRRRGLSTKGLKAVLLARLEASPEDLPLWLAGCTIGETLREDTPKGCKERCRFPFDDYSKSNGAHSLVPGYADLVVKSYIGRAPLDMTALKASVETHMSEQCYFACTASSAKCTASQISGGVGNVVGCYHANALRWSTEETGDSVDAPPKFIDGASRVLSPKDANSSEVRSRCEAASESGAKVVMEGERLSCVMPGVWSSVTCSNLDCPKAGQAGNGNRFETWCLGLTGGHFFPSTADEGAACLAQGEFEEVEVHVLDDYHSMGYHESQEQMGDAAYTAALTDACAAPYVNGFLASGTSCLTFAQRYHLLVVGIGSNDSENEFTAADKVMADKMLKTHVCKPAGKKCIDLKAPGQILLQNMAPQGDKITVELGEKECKAVAGFWYPRTLIQEGECISHKLGWEKATEDSSSAPLAKKTLVTFKRRCLQRPNSYFYTQKRFREADSYYCLMQRSSQMKKLGARKLGGKGGKAVSVKDLERVCTGLPRSAFLKTTCLYDGDTDVLKYVPAKVCTNYIGGVPGPWGADLCVVVGDTFDRDVADSTGARNSCELSGGVFYKKIFRLKEEAHQHSHSCVWLEAKKIARI
jgi:hypothetical protein